MSLTDLRGIDTVLLLQSCETWYRGRCDISEHEVSFPVVKEVHYQWQVCYLLEHYDRQYRVLLQS
jgi:hypothetical protein